MEKKLKDTIEEKAIGKAVVEKLFEGEKQMTMLSSAPPELPEVDLSLKSFVKEKPTPVSPAKEKPRMNKLLVEQEDDLALESTDYEDTDNESFIVTEKRKVIEHKKTSVDKEKVASSVPPSTPFPMTVEQMEAVEVQLNAIRKNAKLSVEIKENRAVVTGKTKEQVIVEKWIEKQKRMEAKGSKEMRTSKERKSSEETQVPVEHMKAAEVQLNAIRKKAKLSEEIEEKRAVAKLKAMKKVIVEKRIEEEKRMEAMGSKEIRTSTRRKPIEETQVPVNLQNLELASFKGGLSNHKAVNQWFNNLQQQVEKAKQDITIEGRKNSYRKLTSDSRRAMTPDMIKAKNISLREEKVIEKKQRKLDVVAINYERIRAKQEQDKHDLIHNQEEKKEKDRVDKKVNQLWERFYEKEFTGLQMKFGKSHNKQRLKELQKEFPVDKKVKATPKTKETSVMRQEQYEQEQLTHLMYTRAVDAFCKEDRTMQHGTVAHYRGKISDEKGGFVVLELLSPVWIGVNFDPVYLGLTKKAPKQWFPMVIGNPRPVDSQTAPSHILTKVKVNYKQGNYNQCLFKSLASALYYVSLKAGGTFITQKVPSIDGLDGKKSLKELKKLMQQGDKQVGDCQAFNTPNGKNRVVRLSTVDLTINKLTIYPTVIILVGNDGSVNHAVTVVDDLIFDSTSSRRFVSWFGAFSKARAVVDIVCLCYFFRGNKVSLLMIYTGNGIFGWPTSKQAKIDKAPFKDLTALIGEYLAFKMTAIAFLCT